MTAFFRLAAFFAVWALTACADLTGGPYVGFNVEKLNTTDWRVTYEGSTTATQDTAQTLGLYRCATIALEQGYDGFEILSDTDLSDPQDTPYHGGGASGIAGAALIGGVLVGPVGAVAGLEAGKSLPQGDAFPVFSSEIKLVKKPFSGQPPRIFDAGMLKATLEPYVNGKKCDKGNVCPHDHGYLQPMM